MDVTVKTLDGQNRSFCVPENITVKQFKEKISSSINIEPDTQRLIFQGRVLQDDKLLKDYDVHGKVIHVVQKPPPSARTQAQGASSTSTSTPSQGGHPGLPRGDVNSYVVGSFTIPSDIIDPNQVQQIVQNAVQNMGDMGRNARVSTRASNDGSSVDVHIHLGQAGGPVQQESESQLRINNARRMLQMARDQIARLENPRQNTSEQSENQPTATAQASVEPEEMEVQESSTSAGATGTSQSTQNAETPSQPSTGSQTGSQSNGQARGPHPPGLIRPPVTLVADVLQEVLDVNRRLQPFLERYQTLTRNDPQLSGQELTEAQELCNVVGEILHTISHCYHSLSDLMIDLSQPPPRHLYAAFISQQVPTAAVIQQTIPVRAQINIGPAVQRSSGTQSSVPTNSAGTQSNQPATSSTGTQSNVPTASASTSTSTEQLNQEQTATAPSATRAPVSTTDTGTTPMMVEMGPEIVSVSSVTAQIIAEPEGASSTMSNTGTTTTTTQGLPDGAGPITNDLIQSIVTSVLSGIGRGGPRFGPGQSNAVVLEIGPDGTQRNRSFRFPTAPGVNRMTAPSNGSAATQPVSATGTQTSSAESNSSGTQTRNENTSETQTQTPRRPTVEQRSFVLPGMPGGLPPGLGGIAGLSMPGMPPPVDRHLPCSSRYFFQHQQRQARNRSRQQGSEPVDEPADINDVLSGFIHELQQQTNPHLNPQTASARTTNGSPPSSQSQPTTTSQGNPPTSQSNPPPSANPFVQMLNEASSNLPGVIGIQIQGMQDGRPAFSQVFGMPPHGRMPAPRPGAPQPGQAGAFPMPPQGDQNFATMLRDFLQTANPQRANATTSSTSSTTTSSTSSNNSSSGGEPVMSDEAFTRLVSGIGSMVSQTAMGQPPSQTISDFLNTLGEGYNTGEGLFINDLFNCVSRHLSLPDLLQIFYGNPASLTRIRAPLQEFVRGRILNDGEPTRENIEAGVNRLIENMQEELRNAEAATEVKPDIDFVKTMSNIFRRHMIAVITMIMRARGDDPQFGPTLYANLRQAFSEVIVLTRFCLVGGMPTLTRLIQNRLSNLTGGVNPLIQQWMASTTVTQINSFVPSITVREEEVLHYVVKKEAQQEAPMETSPVVQSPGASMAESPKSMDVETKNDNKPSPVGAANVVKETVTMASSAAAAGSVQNGATGGEPSTSVDTSWEKEVPAEWVPVINGDIQKQKQQKHQPPFSDAYYQGMPPKRRKLNQTMESPYPSESLSNSIRRAVTAAGVEPISNMNNLTKELEENTEIATEYDENLRSSVINRLNTDGDFVPERFPKSQEYFKGNNRK